MSWRPAWSPLGKDRWLDLMAGLNCSLASHNQPQPFLQLVRTSFLFHGSADDHQVGPGEMTMVHCNRRNVPTSVLRPLVEAFFKCVCFRCYITWSRFCVDARLIILLLWIIVPFGLPPSSKKEMPYQKWALTVDYVIYNTFLGLNFHHSTIAQVFLRESWTNSCLFSHRRAFNSIQRSSISVLKSKINPVWLFFFSIFPAFEF